MISYVSIFSIKILCCTRKEILSVLTEEIEKKKSLSLIFLEGNLLSNILKYKVKQSLKSANYIVPDGNIVAKCCSIMLDKKVSTNPGPDLMYEILKLSLDTKWRHIFFGSTESVLFKIENQIRKRIGNIDILKIVPSFNITDEEMSSHIRVMNQYNPNFVWVALGSPKQEIFVEMYKNQINTDWILPVGAAFDFISLNIKRAPKIIQTLKLEWLHRMIFGGKRLLVRNIKAIPRAFWRYLELIFSER